MSRRRPPSSPFSLFAFQDIITATTGILILLALVMSLSVVSHAANETPTAPKNVDERSLFRNELREEVSALKQSADELASEADTWVAATPSELRAKIETLDRSTERMLAEERQLKEEVLEKLTRLKHGNMAAANASLESELKVTTLQASKILEALAELKNDNRIMYNFRDTNKTPWLAEISDAGILAAKSGASATTEFNSAPAFNRFASGLPNSEQYVVLVVKPSGIANFEKIKAYLSEQGFDIGTELVGEKQTVIHPTKGTMP